MKIQTLIKRDALYESFEQEQMMKEDTGRYNKTYLPWLCLPNPRRKKNVEILPDGYETDNWIQNIKPKLNSTIKGKQFRVPEITYEHEYNDDNYHYYPDEFDGEDVGEYEEKEQLNFEIIAKTEQDPMNCCNYTFYKKSHEFMNNFCMKISGTHQIKKCLDCYYEYDGSMGTCCNGYYFNEAVSHHSNIILSSKNNLLFSKMLFHVLKNIKPYKLSFKEYISLLQLKKYEFQPFIKNFISHLNFKFPAVLVEFVVEYI